MTPPAGWIETDTPTERWRVGGVFRRSFDGKLLHDTPRLSIKPGETGAEAYAREMGNPIPADTRVYERDM